MGPILCSRELPKSSLSNIDVQWSFFKGVIERQRWVLSTAGQNSQYQNVFAQGVSNSVEAHKWILSAAVETREIP
jgi:hypothetical protein